MKSVEANRFSSLLSRVLLSLALAPLGSIAVKAQSGVAQSGVAQSDVAQSDVAQSDVAQSDVAQSDVAQSDGKVVVGIDGHCRVGCWTGVRYVDSKSNFVTGIETRDGDGVRVLYRHPVDSNWMYVIPGSEAAPLVLRADQSEVKSTRFPTIGSPSRGPAMIAREMRWIIALGDPLGIDQIGANQLLRRDSKIGVTNPSEPQMLPDAALGYDGVDMMVITGSSAELLVGLDADQRHAIRQWVIDGGYMLLTLGNSAKVLSQAAPWLIDLLPIDQIRTDKIDPSAMETFTSTQTQLDPFDAVRLDKDKGKVLLRGRTMRRTSTPLAVEYGVGFGKIVVVAADLENEMFSEWPERLDLITQLTGSMLVVQSQEGAARSRSTAYDDLAGQLRASLDQFSSRRSFGFSVVSLILMGLIALIGPLDYLLINRLLGRSLLGWITFPVVAIAFSVVLVTQSQPANGSRSANAVSLSRPNAGVEINQIEILDVDTTTGVGRGFAARYFYTHHARQIDVDVSSSVSLRSIGSSIQTLLTVPFGYPGPAFGGIPIAIEDARLPTYQISIQNQPSGRTSKLFGLPIASRSSKGIVSRCRFVPDIRPVGSLQRRIGSELLEGELTNPLPVDLFDGLLVFRNWAYRLPTRFPAGGSVESVAALRQKNFRWQLSRQEALEESERQTEPWDPTNLDSLDRIAEMLMFHDAAGGSRYTSLRHDPLSTLDLSAVLTDNRCMLVGRLNDPLTNCQTRNHGSKDADLVEQDIGNSLSLIRVVLPVNDNSRR